MYSLFWRIFLSFWVTVLVAEFVTVWSTVGLSGSDIHPALQQENRKFVENSRRAADVLRDDGMSALQAWRAKEENVAAIDALYLLDSEGREINGRALPPDVSAYIGDYATHSFLANHVHPIEDVLTFDVVTPSGEFYVLVTLFQQPHVLSYMLTPQRVTVGVIVSGIICFLLARYIAAPIVRLRQTTQALADGRLDTRPPPTLRARKDEFGALAGDFDYMAAQLNELIGSQKQLLRDISHELRSPLARIQVALGLARGQPGGEVGGELDRIERETDRLNALIDELLTLVRLSYAKKQEKNAPIEIQDLLTNIVNDAGFERSGGCPSFITLEHCDCALISANEPLLYSAIENVVRNACNYAPEKARIVVRCDAVYDQITITVDDNGPGIPDDMLSRVFDPFVRVSSAREKETGGYGIGLAIAKRAIELHGGTISARNNEGRNGLTVTITLPIIAQERRKRAVE